MARQRQRTPFAQRLRQARELAGLTQVQLAKQVGMSTSTLGEAETTAQGSSYTAQIARVCNVSAEWLATGIGEPRPELVAERAKLSADAVRFALSYENLEPPVRELWKTMVQAASQMWAAQQRQMAANESSGVKQHPSSPDQLSHNKITSAVQTHSPETDDLFLVHGTTGEKNAAGGSGAVPKQGRGRQGKKAAGSGGKR